MLNIIYIFFINIFSKEPPGGHRSLRGRGGGHSHGQELHQNYEVKQYQNKTKQF